MTLASGARAQGTGLDTLSINPEAPPEALDNTTSISAPVRGHLEIWDWYAGAIALGATYGIVQTEGQADGASVHGAIIGHMVLASLTLLNPADMNPFVRRHPPRPAAGVVDFRRRYDWRTRVRIETTDGRIIHGDLTKRRDDLVVVRTESGPLELGDADLARIHTLGDPWWDNAVGGALAGAGWGLIAANNCSGDHVVYVDRGKSAALGAAIVGGTGLIMDLLHDGRFLLYENPRDRKQTSVRYSVQPDAWAGGLRVDVRF